MINADVVGLVAGFFTTVSLLPQVIRTIRTKSAGDLAVWMILFFIVGIILWLVYGIMTMRWPIIIANAVTFIFAMILLACKVIYRCKK
jgi:MtN3 and saliva related transmembrane protein